MRPTPSKVLLVLLTLTGSFLTHAAAQQPVEKHRRPAEEAADVLQKEHLGLETHAAPHEEKDMFGRSLDLAIWTWVVFLLLFFILGRFAWKPMLDGLKKREETIRTALDDAANARNEAQKLRADLQKELDKANERVRDILDEARRDAQSTTEEMLAKARSEIGAERDRLRREIDTARDQALQRIWQESADLATLISARTIRRHLTPDDHRKLIDEALVDFRRIGERGIKEVTKII